MKIGHYVYLPPLSDEDVALAHRNADLVYLTFTEYAATVWKPDNPEAFLRNQQRGQYAEIGFARAIGREPSPTRDPRIRRPTWAEVNQPDIPPNIEVRSTPWRLPHIGDTDKWGVDVPASCLVFLDKDDKARKHDRKFVLVAVDTPQRMKALGWAYGREIKAEGMRSTKGWYLDPTQLRGMDEPEP